MTFGASDTPLKAEELEKAGLVQFPMVMGGIVPVVNLEGIKPGELMLDGPTLAKIFLGEIKTWDDPAIAKLNPKAKLPTQAIAVVHRSDGSGTTFNFTNYLSKVSADWKSKVGANTSVEWPVGIGAKGNEGVANNVAQTKGSIGYVEYAYAKQNKLTYTKMVNKDGKTVAPTSRPSRPLPPTPTGQTAPGYRRHPRPTSRAPKSWPIDGATFILMYKKPQDPAAAGRGAQVLRLGLSTRAARWPRSSTTSRCRPTWSTQHQEDLGDRDQGRRRQAALCKPQLSGLDAGKGALRRLSPRSCLGTVRQPRAWASTD